MIRQRIFSALVLFLGTISVVASGSSQSISNAAPRGGDQPKTSLNADDDAKTIINKAFNALGGEKAFSRWNCGVIKYKTKGGVIPVEFGEAIVEDTFQLPGHFKRVVNFSVEGKPISLVFVMTEGKGWIKRGDTEVVPTDDTFTRNTEHPFAGLFNVSKLDVPKARLTKLGMPLIAGHEAIGPRVELEGIGQFDLFLNKQSGLLMKTLKPPSVEVLLENYKEIQGAKVPTRLRTFSEGKLLADITITELTFRDKIDPGVFAKP